MQERDGLRSHAGGRSQLAPKRARVDAASRRSLLAAIAFEIRPGLLGAWLYLVFGRCQRPLDGRLNVDTG
jgi:hypothetical protein